jgi:hypothetical protein
MHRLATLFAAARRSGAGPRLVKTALAAELRVLR